MLQKAGALAQNSDVVTASHEKHGGDSTPPDPARLAYLRQLIAALLEGRRLSATYNYVLLAILAILTACHLREKLVATGWWRARFSRRRARCSKTTITISSHRPCQQTDASSSSSSSTIQGTATPPEVGKDEGAEGERRPLLGYPRQSTALSPSSRPGPWTLVASLLAYQPRRVPFVNKTLPSNGTSLFVLCFLGINVFFQFYHAPLVGNLLFAFADRAGCMFVVNLPLLYLLAAKNQPLKHLTGQSYEALNIFHRRVGELLCLLAAVHFGGMIAFQLFKPEWLMRGTFWDFLQHRLVLLGIGAFVSYELLYLTSLGSVRQRWYELFLASHVLLQSTALVFLWLHYHTARPYVTAALVIFAVDRLVWRLLIKQTTLSADLTVLPDGDTILLSANWDVAPATALQRGIKAGWKPTDHVFLTVPALGRTHALQTHPFTIASAGPSSTGGNSSSSISNSRRGAAGGTPHAWLNLLIRAHSGFTRDLLHYAHRHKTVSVRLDGPYGSSHAMDTLRSGDDVILIAGGSGIAVTFPLAWALLKHHQEDEDRGRGVAPAGLLLESGGDEGKDAARRVRLLWIIHSDEHRYWVPGSLLDDLVAAGLHLVVSRPTAIAGRPDVQGHVQSWIREADADGRQTRVLVSGPDGLNRDVRNTCSQAMWGGSDVRVVVEKFGW
ncbi:conserved hypothetical protein [Verticillium alfalfae VaMs.102]|uniref:FAD-binding FR-type domain-containing protein n=1 Tax=Verticillium alfalfae (strain VaMs.102 / ATCC MYA-4576 / FGSC 10136) TaxID=526221 RepID=C9SW14_VERA1|nr:conserved hypothetical protein [Verticillium alfalfae VaMs.102]EEY22979.1 conserved hypothetical protein [Verticillium alfalfae VaMs.102]